MKRKPVPSATFAQLPPSQTSQLSTTEQSSSLNSKYEPVTDEAVAALDTAHDDMRDASQTRNPKSGSRRRGGRQPWKLWKYELLSLSVACMSFVAIIVLLRVFEDQDLTKWKAPIAINAVVAILSAIFKGSLAVPISDGKQQYSCSMRNAQLVYQVLAN